MAQGHPVRFAYWCPTLCALRELEERHAGRCMEIDIKRMPCQEASGGWFVAGHIAHIDAKSACAVRTLRLLSRGFCSLDAATRNPGS